VASNSKLMDEAQLLIWILRRLGAPFLKVELTKEHLQDAVESARRWFAAKKGVQKQVTIPILPSQTEYQLPDGVDTVQDFAMQATSLDLSLAFYPYTWIDGSPIPYDTFSTPQSGGLYSSLVQTLQYVEEAKRILGAEQEWWQQGRTLYIAPPPKSAGNAIITAKSSDIVIEQLSERDHDLVKRSALARAKLDLGRVRSKYDSGFATAQGHEQLDGPTLLQEGQAELDVLDEEIGLSAMPMAFVTG
jgi:hypothetical protein